ncbi:MAG TPA: PPE domain-containing protein [Actinophytocola sp.]|uniref:WXG100 family type VII secretion target n=1 Tax=Actinophytocola sp. TaxID=1872138 RepID=UPI002DDC9FA7|nr:PPE domain-containing protein [Actinophytocola sp.]HEV2779012.1 PPE domain-containing protein [Actinophytocola sp.]
MAKKAHGDKGMVVGKVRRVSSDSGLGDRIRPADGVHWEGYTHRQMWDMIMRSNPDDLFARVEQWRTVANTLLDRNRALQQRLNTLLDTWHGPAADAAAASQQRLLNWAQETVTRASAVGTQLGNYGNALVSARLRMPQPQHRWAELSFRDGEGANVLDGVPGAHLLLQMASDRLPTAQQAREAKREAVQIMRELEGNAVEAERAMPQFSDAPQTTTGTEPNHQWRPQPTSTLAGPGRPLIQDARPSFDGTTTAQVVGEPVGYGSGQSGGSHPYGRGGADPLAGRAPLGGDHLGVIGKSPLPQAGTPGGSVVGGSATRAAAPGLGGGLMPATAGGRSPEDEDTIKPLADYLEPEDIFMDDRPVSPPVWGV